MRPDPEMQRAARQGGPDRKSDISTADIATEHAEHQVRRIVRLYALSVQAARIVAEMAYAAGLPR
jgi:hypothetical protein